MKRFTHFVLVVWLSMAGGAAGADDDWKPMFNADDFEGWVNVNGAPETWRIKDGVISCTGRPIAALRTARLYENFEMELEWRHLQPGGNAGIFVWASALPAVGQPFLRAIEVQVLDNGYAPKDQNKWFTTHGDVFPIHGASMTPMRPQTHEGDPNRCFPSEFRSRPAPEWNHYRLVANNGSIRLSVNGKEVSGGDNCHWRKGYLGLESEGSPTEWRNVRIKELPGSGATFAQTAPHDGGWRRLYNGADLRDWKQESADGTTAWRADDWVLHAPRQSPAPRLTTEAAFPDFWMIVDIRRPKESAASAPAPTLLIGGPEGVMVPLASTPGVWERRMIRVREGRVRSYDFLSNKRLTDAPLPAGIPTPTPLSLIPAEGEETSFANIFINEGK